MRLFASLAAAHAVETESDGGIGGKACGGDGFAALGAKTVFVFVDAFEGGGDLLTLDLAAAGLRLCHGLILQRVHARQTPDGLLVEHDGFLTALARQVFGIEGGETLEEGCAGVHVWSVGCSGVVW